MAAKVRSDSAKPSEGASQSAPSQASPSWASSAAVRSVMQGNRGRDTRPELALRSAVHSLGLRYRKNMRPVPSLRRSADLVFTRARVAVFLDGCFWHGCPDHYRPATTNAGFWQRKVDENRSRDLETDRALAEAGWAVLRFWEHDNPAAAAEVVSQAVRLRSASGSR
jgi:DNA mismatch endonuclease (patch repair protein)